MYKHHFDKCLEDSKKNKTYDELYADYTALSMLETHDRAVSNNILSGSSAADLTQLFIVFNELKEGFSYKKRDELHDLLEKCEYHWNNIRNFLVDMNDPTRSSKAEETMRRTIKEAATPISSVHI